MADSLLIRERQAASGGRMVDERHDRFPQHVPVPGDHPAFGSAGEPAGW